MQKPYPRIPYTYRPDGGLPLCVMLSSMAIQTVKKHRQNLPIVDMRSVIVNVPVKIAVMLDDEMLGEFEHVVQLAFATTTAAGKSHMKDFHNLTARGIITTENALFTIAIGEFHNHAVETFVKLAHTEVVNRAAGHAIHMPMKLNGEITYR